MEGTFKKIIGEGLMKGLFTLKVKIKGPSMGWGKTQRLAIVIYCTVCYAYSLFPVHSELETIVDYKL